MSPTLRLTLSTPASILVDAEAIVSLRAEDESGSFGILPGHADFLTVLTPSVLRWRDAENVERFCAVEEGVLRGMPREHRVPQWRTRRFACGA